MGSALYITLGDENREMMVAAVFYPLFLERVSKAPRPEIIQFISSLSETLNVYPSTSFQIFFSFSNSEVRQWTEHVIDTCPEFDYVLMLFK